MIMSTTIVNVETVNVIIPRALKAMGMTKVQSWPGTDLIVGADGEAEAEAALALIDTSYFAYYVVSYSILVLLHQNTTHSDVL
jgi:hypothetical protein